MTFSIPLHRDLFGESERVIARSGEFTATAFRYSTGIESVKISNSRGYVEVLPFMGHIIWAAEFDGVSLTMDNMFAKPQPAKEIVETYGCFAFHSGLLANGCPAPEDTHPLHGEFPCMDLGSAELVVADGSLAIASHGEYVMGFGHHYEATPVTRLYAGSGVFDIDLSVTNLSKYQPMPLQYMCHMNYAFVPGATMSQSLPDGAFRLRETIPAHVTPTPAWEEINKSILAGEKDPDSLEGAEEYDPEIVFFADDLPQYGEDLEFWMNHPDGTRFVTRFASSDFPVATRWYLHNADQKVAAFVLPGTSRPEGFLAAQKAGMLLSLGAGETRAFHVSTGLVSTSDSLDKE